MDQAYLERMGNDRIGAAAPPLCQACGYNLTGTASKRCPECGWVTTPKELARQAEELRLQIAELEDVNKWIWVGFKAAAIGWGARLVGEALNLAGAGCVTFGIRVLAFPCGLAAFCLGMTAFRTRRIPEWARDQLPSQPNSSMAWATALLGLLLAASSFVTFR